MKRCPRCSTLAPNDAWLCECGYEFVGNETPEPDASPSVEDAMLRPVVIAGLTVVYAVAATSYRSPRYAIIDPVGLLLYALYYPALIVAVVLLFIGIARIRRADTRAPAIVLCLLSLVMPAVATVHGAARLNRGRSADWPGVAIPVADCLLDYHDLQPAAFHYVGPDEEVVVSGFADYLRKQQRSGTAPVWVMRMKTKRDQVLDPWGAPIRFGLDRNHDGYIDMQGERVGTDGMDPPNLDYRVAVAASLSRPDNGEFRPHARRR